MPSREVSVMSKCAMSLGASARTACLGSRLASVAPTSAREVGTASSYVDPSRDPRRRPDSHSLGSRGRLDAGDAPPFASPSRGFAATSTSCSVTPTTSDSPERASHSHTRHVGVSKPTEKLRAVHAKHVLYRGPWVLPFRTLVRFKIAQLAGIGALSAPLAAVLNNDPLSYATSGAVAAVVGGSVACSLALQYYASRYVGELSLVAPGEAGVSGNSRERGGGSVPADVDARIRISTMNFWGARADADVSVSSITPPLHGLSRLAYADAASRLFIPLDVSRSGRRGERVWKQHVLCLKHGVLTDKKRLFQLLTGIPIDPIDRGRQTIERK